MDEFVSESIWIDFVPQRLHRVAWHIHRNRGRYAIMATFVATVWMFNKLDRKSTWDEFLKEHNLYEEFYTPDEW